MKRATIARLLAGGARAAVTFGVAACGPAPDERVQAVLETYAPDVALGSRVSAEARERYQLTVAPYMGYRDSAYVAPDGLHDLGLRVDEYVDDARPRVSRWARVESVLLAAPDSAALAAAESRLRGALGAPEVSCRQGAQRWRELRWRGSGGRGVRLISFVAPGTDLAAETGSAADVAGLVEFGAEDDPQFAPPAEPCDAIEQPV